MKSSGSGDRRSDAAPAVEQPADVVEAEPSAPGRRRRSRYRNAPLISGLSIIGLFVVGSFLIPWLSPYDAFRPVPADALQGPSSSHYFGTDVIGYDVFVRVAYAPRVNLSIAVPGVLIGALLGVSIGVAAGFSRRFAGEVVMRVADLLQAFPLLILALAIVALTGQSNLNIIGAIAFINTPVFLRLVRSQVISIRELGYVEVAEALGNPVRRIVYKHILPNAMGPAIVQFGVSLGYAILVLAGLSFLGLGVAPPTPEWGGMIRTGASALTTGQWWTVLFPGLALGTAVASFNLVSEGIEIAREI